MNLTEERLRRLVLSQAKALTESGEKGKVLDPDADLSSLGLNSMALLAILKRINTEFGLDITPEEAVNLNTLRKVVAFVESRTG